MLQKKLSLIELYDEYQALLTPKQRRVFEMHYFEDWSLSEIADELGVSKQAVADAIKKAGETLEHNESCLRLCARMRVVLDGIKKALTHEMPDNVRSALQEIINI